MRGKVRYSGAKKTHLIRQHHIPGPDSRRHQAHQAAPAAELHHAFPPLPVARRLRHQQPRQRLTGLPDSPTRPPSDISLPFLVLPPATACQKRRRRKPSSPSDTMPRRVSSPNQTKPSTKRRQSPYKGPGNHKQLTTSSLCASASLSPCSIRSSSLNTRTVCAIPSAALDLPRRSAPAAEWTPPGSSRQVTTFTSAPLAWRGRLPGRRFLSPDGHTEEVSRTVTCKPWQGCGQQQLKRYSTCLVETLLWEHGPAVL